MALTKNKIMDQVADLGFAKKKSIDIVESLLEGALNRVKMLWCPASVNSA